MERAIEKSREGLEKAGELTRQEGDKLKSYLRRDLEQAASRIETVGEHAKEQLEPKIKKAEEGFLNLTYHLAHGASDVFGRLAEWADSSAAYHTGQITSPGSLQCRHCDKTMNFKKSGNIPPCPSCHKTEFRRVS